MLDFSDIHFRNGYLYGQRNQTPNRCIDWNTSNSYADQENDVVAEGLILDLQNRESP